MKSFKIFFSTNRLVSQKNPNFERFENVFSSSQSLRQICHFSDFWISSKLLFEIPFFFSKKLPFFKILKNITISVAYNGKFAICIDFKRFEDFYWKPIYFLKNSNFPTFWRILLSQSHSTANLITSGNLKNSKFFSRQTQLFSHKNPFFECFENSHCSSHLLRQLWCLQRF